jgi:hypothetical protein
MLMNAVFLDVTTCVFCEDRHYGRKVSLVFLFSVFHLPVTANAVPSSLILFTLIIEAVLSSDTSVLTGAARCHIPEDGIIQSPL